MKVIAIDCHIFDQNFQGIRTFLSGIIKELVHDKSISIILMAKDLDNIKNIFGEEKANVKYVKLNSSNKFIRLGFEIPKIIRKHQCTHALFNYSTPLFKIKGCQFLTVLHDVLFLDFPEYFPLKYRVKHKILFKLSIKLSSQILTVSDYSRQRLNKHFHLEIEKKNIIPNSVDEQFNISNEKKLSKEIVLKKYQIQNYILFVSRIETRKNHLSILKWYIENKIFEKNIQLIFVGKFAFNFEEIETIFNRSSIETNGLFKHLSQVNNDELFHLNNAAKVSIFPSLCEGFGIPPLESAFLSTPTICSNKTAMEDFDFFGEYHIDPQTSFFTDKIEEIIFNSDEYFQNNFEDIALIIKERYTWKKSADKLIKIIKE